MFRLRMLQIQMLKIQRSIPDSEYVARFRDVRIMSPNPGITVEK